MRLWKHVAVCLLLAGCVAPSEVREASSEIGTSLVELRRARDELRGRALRELEETKQIVGRAIVAESVNDTVRSLAAEEAGGDLLEIARTVREQRRAAQGLVDRVMGRRTRGGRPPEDVVAEVFGEQAAAAARAADALEAAGRAESAARLRQRAERFEGEAAEVPGYRDMLVLVELSAVEAEFSLGLKDLEDVLLFLQLVHGEVDRWIRTDVRVDGEQVAALLEEHAPLLGLDDRKAGAP